MFKSFKSNWTLRALCTDFYTEVCIHVSLIPPVQIKSSLGTTWKKFHCTASGAPGPSPKIFKIKLNQTLTGKEYEQFVSLKSSSFGNS